MKRTTKTLHLFSQQDKVLVRLLAIYGVKWPEHDSNPTGLHINRAQTRSGQLILEVSNIKASYNAAHDTLFLSDIFLTPEFGLALEFGDRGSIYLLATQDKSKAVSPLIFKDAQGDTIAPDYHFELGRIK